jgi:ATP phosphoribosyltransferase regulatory subunit
MPLLNLPDFTPALLAELAARQTTLVTIPVIQPAAPFLDMAGEDLRRRIFTTESETGEALCLRPEFTIPVCMGHIEAAAGTPKRYAYVGEVFRQRREGDNEFYQAGIEDLGDPDIAAADARAVTDAGATLTQLLPGRELATTVGDQTVFEAVVAALGLPDGWQTRLIRTFGDVGQLDALLARLSSQQPDLALDGEAGRLIAAHDREGLLAYIAERMAATGYSTNASRTPADIADRLLEKARLAQARLTPDQRTVLEEFLALDLPLADAPDALARFARKAGLDIAAALSLFDWRVRAIEQAAGATDLSKITYRAAFGRPLDYYTGLVFEVTAGDSRAVLAGGGRYDRMLTLLGAPHPIPAVGFALWLDRVAQLRGTTA